MITEQQLNEWEELAKAATPGEWHAIQDSVIGSGGDYNFQIADMYNGHFADAEVEANAAFIAASRTAVPALVEMVRELEAENERLWEATKWFVARAGDFDGIPPSKYFGDTDFQMQYPNGKEITVTLGQLRALRTALGRQS